MEHEILFYFYLTSQTASATAGLLYNLANNQKVQDKLRQDVMERLPNPDTPLTPESLNSLPYMRACLKESMRRTPIIPGNVRCAGRDIVLQGYQIPKGVIYLTHMSDIFFLTIFYSIG